MDEIIPQEMLTVVIGGFGYRVRHAAQIPDTAIGTAYWPSGKYPFKGARTPIVALCGKVARSVQPVVIVYTAQPGKPPPRPTCPLCVYRVDDRGLSLSYPDRPEVPE